MPMMRAALLVMGVAVGMVAGPLVSAQGGVSGDVGGGLLAMAAFFAIPWSWSRWSYLTKPAAVAGAVVGLALILGAYSAVPDVYLKQHGQTSEVVVTGRTCQETKGRCTYWLALAAPDGRAISGLMREREKRVVGDRFTATWDSTGVIGPRPADVASSGPFGMLLLPGVIGFLAGTVLFSVLGDRRRDQ
ncbi:hypothetical protein [Streptosporangium sp. 'caverna']|uniref:hypothetical protein n=1 Tax=Streptosporangium sp. 'caverna' TaxID=2202249 RepID=UPI000D7D30DC|nr:hypothetical protein [Streptosporangium sp. 'caverna']AWS41710.1 hypothetical protein DKM19_10460 [Streptosporangium sp. 'caverna']